MDRYLVTFQKNSTDAVVAAVFIMVLAALFALWTAVLPSVPHVFPRLNQAEENRARAVDATLSPTARLGLAGSSLMYRLEPVYFSVPVSNVAIAGGNPVTSAEIAGINPAADILVEVNILDRRSDSELESIVESASHPLLSLRAFRLLTTPVRATVASVFRLDAAEGAKAHALAARLQTLLDGPPAAPLDPASLNDYVKAWNTRAPAAEQTSANAERLKQIADRLAIDGIKLHYILLPAHPEMQKTAYYRRGIDAMKAADPQFDSRFIDIPWDYDELRWEKDGVHLDLRSAALASRQIETAFKLEKGEAAP